MRRAPALAARTALRAGGRELSDARNEHPKQGISTQIALADGIPVAGARLDLLNGTDPAAFDGTLELAPYESCIVVLGATGSAGAATAGDEATCVDEPWAVTFSAPGTDAFGESVELADLHDLSSTEFPGKAGTFRYQASFVLGEAAARTVIDLGEVFETATVTLDGKSLGTRICPPYRFEAGALLAGEHALAIDIINTLDHAVPDVFGMTEPSDPSGLLGPVRVLG